METAALGALNRMGIAVEAKEKTDQGKRTLATGVDRRVEIELESVSVKSARIRTVAKQGLFFRDRATATEIILQTEKILNGA